MLFKYDSLIQRGLRHDHILLILALQAAAPAICASMFPHIIDGGVPNCRDNITSIYATLLLPQKRDFRNELDHAVLDDVLGRLWIRKPFHYGGIHQPLVLQVKLCHEFQVAWIFYSCRDQRKHDDSTPLPSSLVSLFIKSTP